MTVISRMTLINHFVRLFMLIALALPVSHAYHGLPGRVQLASPVISRAPRRHRRAAITSVDMPSGQELWAAAHDAWESVRARVIFERGALRILDPDLAAFVGGAVGVIGTVESIMARRRAVRDRLTCVYCDGSGSLGCGVCFGTGIGSDGLPCGACSGTGKVDCVSCQGSGNSVLLAEDRNLIRELAGLGTMTGELETEIDR